MKPATEKTTKSRRATSPLRMPSTPTIVVTLGPSYHTIRYLWVGRASQQGASTLLKAKAQCEVAHIGPRDESCKVTLEGCTNGDGSDNATQGRNDEFKTTSRGAPQRGAAIVGNRLASLQCDSGHHRQAQRGRHEHRAALAREPAAPPGLQGQAGLIGRIGQPKLGRSDGVLAT